MYEHLRLFDDRARRVRPYKPLTRGISHQERADFPEEEFQKVRRSLVRAAGCVPAASAAGCLVMMVLGVVQVIVALVTRQWSPYLPRGLFWLGLGAFGAYSFRWGFGNSDVRLLQREMLAIGRCPSCAYPIRDTPADPDGLTVCPECAAAWRVPVRAAARA